jgi:hypothetical protein
MPFLCKLTIHSLYPQSFLLWISDIQQHFPPTLKSQITYQTVGIASMPQSPQKSLKLANTKLVWFDSLISFWSHKKDSCWCFLSANFVSWPTWVLSCVTMHNMTCPFSRNLPVLKKIAIFLCSHLLKYWPCHTWTYVYIVILVFHIGSHAFAFSWLWTVTFYLWLLGSWDDRGMPPLSLLIEVGSH